VVEGGAVSDPKALVAALTKSIGDHDVLRLKGFLEIKGKPMRMVIQAVGKRIDTYFDRDWQPDEKRGSRLVVIGQHDFDEGGVLDEVAAALT
jgi:cobalamin biosynthesis protein CobW